MPSWNRLALALSRRMVSFSQKITKRVFVLNPSKMPPESRGSGRSFYKFTQLQF